MLTSEDRAGIRARIDNCRTYNFGMRDADRLAHEDAETLLAALGALEAQLAAIEKLLEKPIFLRTQHRGYAYEDYTRPLVEANKIRHALTPPSETTKNTALAEGKPAERGSGR
jgi:hypothetical protein